MYSTKRLLDRRFYGALAVFAVVTGTVSATVSCSSDPSAAPIPDEDANAPTPSPSGDDDGGVPGDAAVRDAANEDAAKPDAGPLPSRLPVVCTGAPCATSLVTVLGEGFCVLLQDETVACWGDNANGQLGRGPDSGVTPSATAERVLDLTDIVELDRGCAIDKNGDTWCWGTGPWLRTSAATTREPTPVKLPIPPAKTIRVARSSANAGTACALVDEGVLCWGTNVHGQVTVPVLNASATTAYPPADAGIPPGAPIRDLAIGDATFAIREDRTAISWGANPQIARVSSLFPDPYPRPISLTDITQIDAANDNVCAVAGASVYCWGRAKDTTGYVPPPFERAFPDPVVLPERGVFVATAAGASTDVNRLRGCAVGASGALYCWGDNAQGQVGDGTRDYALSPVKIDSLPGPVAQVKTTVKATCALLTSGRVFCWGDDSVGQLGGGQLRFPSPVPKEVVLP